MGNCSSQGAKLSVQKFFKAAILSNNDAKTAEELGTGNLEVTKYELVLHRRGMQTQRWPYIFLTRCDYKGNIFRIETKNPQIPDKTMEHIFRVKYASLLLQRIQAQIVENSLTNKSATVSGSKHSLVTSESDKSAQKENIDPDGVIYPSRIKRIEAELDVPQKHHFANLPDNPSTFPSYPIPQSTFAPNLQQLQHQHLQQQRVQQNEYMKQQNMLAVPPQQNMFFQQQRNQLSDFIYSRNTDHPNKIYSDADYHPPIQQPFYMEIPGEYLYPTNEERHLANNNFSKVLKNNELKRKYSTNNDEESNEISAHTKLSKKHSSLCKRINKHKKPTHFPNHHGHHHYNRHGNHLNDSDDVSILQESHMRRMDTSLNRSMYRSLDMLDIGRGSYDKKGPIHYL